VSIDNVDTLEVDTMELEELDLFTETAIPQTTDEFFDDFMYSYISNRSFAKTRTNTGVEMLDMDEEEATLVIYEREADLELQKDTNISKVTIERIIWDNNSVYNYIFNKVSGKWFLTEENFDEVSNTPNAAFLIFLNDFLTDSIFQYNSIKHPLLFIFYSEEDDAIIKTEMSLEEWKNLITDLPPLNNYIFNIDYGQLLISTNRKSVLLKGLSNGLLMKFHFVFNNGVWQLCEIEG